MNQMKSILIVVLSVVVVVVVACVQTTESTTFFKEEGKEINFTLDTAFVIKLPKNLRNISNYYQPYGSNSVYIFDESTKYLFQIKLNSGKISRLFSILYEGNLETFTIDEKKRNCFFFFNDHFETYDFEGSFISSTYFDGKCGEKGVLTVQSNYFRPIIDSTNLYMHYFPLIEGTYTKPHFFNQPIEAKINFEDNSFGLMETGYPSNYKAKCYGFNYIPERFIMHNPDEFGYTFTYNDSLFVENTINGDKKVYFFGSRLNTPSFKYLNFDNITNLNKTVFDDLYLENPFYGFSVSLPLSGCYARTLLSYDKNKGAFSQVVCLYGSELNYIGESKKNKLTGIICDYRKDVIILLSSNLKQNHLYITKVKW